MASWIWKKGGYKPDEYVDFKKTFKAEGKLPAKLRISVNTDYIAYLNGEKIANGQYRDYPDYKVYDEIDISEKLLSGDNELKIIAYYLGEGFFTSFGGRAGLYFEIEEGKNIVAESDENTLSGLSAGYRSYNRVIISPQLGYTYAYDENAAEIGTVFSPSVVVKPLAEGRFIPRPVLKCEELSAIYGTPIMQGLFSEGKEERLAVRMLNSALLYRDKKDILVGDLYKTDEKCDGIYAIFDLGREDCGYFTIEVETDRPTDIQIAYGEHLVCGRVASAIHVRNFVAEYRTAKGENSFTGYFRRFGARYLQIFALTNKIRIKRVGLIPVRYPLEELSYDFGNLLRNEIYRVSLHTLKLCVHESYEDCPWREQSLYNMDSRNQMLCGYYAFKEYRMPKASLELMTHGMRDDGLLTIVFPAGSDYPIPSFTLAFITQLKEYCAYSGDKEFGREKLAFCEKLLSTFLGRSEGGLIKSFYNEKIWDFYEWEDTLDGGDKDDKGFECALSSMTSYALGSFVGLLEMLGEDEKAKYYGEKQAEINAAIKKAFFDKKEGLFKTFTNGGDRKPYSVLINAVCVLCGAAEGLDTTEIEKALKYERSENIVPCTLSMSCFRYDALLKISPRNGDYIISDIDERYLKMFKAGATTFWETEKGAADFDGAGSLCHGWSAIPIVYYTNLLK